MGGERAGGGGWVRGGGGLIFVVVAILYYLCFGRVAFGYWRLIAVDVWIVIHV